MPTDKAETLVTLGKALATLDDRITKLTEQRDTLRAEILSLHPDEGEVGMPNGGRLVISRQHNLDLEAIAAKWPYDQRPELYDPPKITAGRVRHNIAQADLETFDKPSAASVRVK